MHSMSLITFLASLLAVLNPIGNAAIYVSLVSEKPKSHQHKVAVKCAIAVAIIMTLVIWVGLPLLHFFGISLGAFQIAGGLVVLLIGLSMIRAKSHSNDYDQPEKQQSSKAKSSVAIVPMAMPIIGGPGAISAIIAHAPAFPGVLNHLILTVCCLVLSAVIGVVLWFAPLVSKVLGEEGMRIATRIMGLVLAAIAVQMMAGGVAFFVHQIATGQMTH